MRASGSLHCSYERLHPTLLFVYFLLVLAVTMLLRHPVFLGMEFLLALFWIRTWNICTIRASSVWYVLAGFLTLTFLNPLISQEGATVLFYFNEKPITWEALLYGALSAGMMLNTLLWCLIMSRVMTTDRLLCVCGKRFLNLGMVITLVFRFLPLFIRQYTQIKEGQCGLYGSEDGSFKEAFRRTKQALLAMMTWSLDHGMRTAEAMISRGYGIGARGHYARYHWRRKDLFALAGLVLCAILTFVPLGLGYAACEVYPSFWWKYSDIGDWICMAAFLGMLCIPMWEARRMAG